MMAPVMKMNFPPEDDGAAAQAYENDVEPDGDSTPEMDLEDCSAQPRFLRFPPETHVGASDNQCNGKSVCCPEIGCYEDRPPTANAAFPKKPR
jgi:hypothetical protein